MYGKLFDDLGYDFEIEHVNAGLGICRVRIAKRG